MPDLLTGDYKMCNNMQLFLILLPLYYFFKKILERLYLTKLDVKNISEKTQQNIACETLF